MRFPSFLCLRKGTGERYEIGQIFKGFPPDQKTDCG